MADELRLIGVQNDRTGKIVGYRTVPASTACEIIGKPYNKDNLPLLSPTMPAGDWRLICSQDVFVEASKADFENAPGNGGSTGDGSGFDDTYSYVLVGEDMNGTDFVSDPAPKVVAVDRTLPRLDGNDYAFPVQTAQNTYLPLRHPPTSTKWIIPYPGPDLVDADQRAAVLSRGFSAVTDSVPNRGLYTRTKLLVNLSGGYDEANIAANRLLDSDPRKAILKRYYDAGGGRHELVTDPAAAEWMGREVLKQKQNSDWTSGASLYAITLNFEVGVAASGSGLSDEQARMDMIGLVMRGVRNQALDYGQTVPLLICYDHSGLAHYNLSLLSKDITTASGTYSEDGSNTPYSGAEIGAPGYYLKERLALAVQNRGGSGYMATTNEMVKYVKEFGGYMGSQEYMNTPWDNQDLWQVDSNGKPITRKVAGVNLWTIRTDARTTSIMGESCQLLGPGYYSVSDADNFLFEWYQRASYAIIDYDVRAGGQHLAPSTVRQSGFEKMGLSYWQRVDAEFKHDNRIQNPNGSGFQNYDRNVLNTRPMNPDFIEFDTIWAAVVGGYDIIRPWMAPQPTIDTPGKSVSGDNHARGAYEIYNKIQNRLSEVDWLKSNVTRPLVGELPIRNFARDRAWHNYNDEFEKKPLVGGRLCSARTDKNGKPWIVIVGAYAAQKPGHVTAVTWWPIKKDGSPRGGSYTFQLTGRSTYLETFQLPDDYADLEPADIRYRLVDLTGDTRVRHMDWNTPIPTTNLTPPVAAV